MAYSSSDIRKTIRNTIGHSRYMNDMDCSTVSVTDDWGDKVFIPMYLPGEVRTGDLPPFPFIEMTLVASPTTATNIGGDVRDMDVYFDFNIYYVDIENITPTEFGKTISDEIIDKITDARSSTSYSYFVEIINDGREIIEAEEGKQVVFHRVLECHVKNYS